MLKPHEQRVVDELSELSAKRSKLRVFIGSNVFMSLEPVDQHLLEEQSHYMLQYEQTLAKRIARFKDD